jgi:hypothetical protein
MRNELGIVGKEDMTLYEVVKGNRARGKPHQTSFRKAFILTEIPARGLENHSEVSITVYPSFLLGCLFPVACIRSSSGDSV